MNQDGNELRLEGTVYDPKIKDTELATERYATLLTFRLDRWEGNPPQLVPQDVTLRGNPRVRGTVFEHDRVSVFGMLDEKNNMRATHIQDKFTSANVQPITSISGVRDSEDPVVAGTVMEVIPSSETHKRWWQGSKPLTHSVLNIRLRPLGAGADTYVNVELRGVPDVWGEIYVDDEVRVFGEEGREGVFRASRIEKEGGSVEPVRLHNPRSRALRTLLRIGAGMLLLIFVLFMLFVVVGFFGFWDLLLRI